MIVIKHRRALLPLAVLLGACGGSPAPKLAAGSGQPEPPASPVLALSAASLAFTTTAGVGPAPQVIVVSNAGGGEFGPPTTTLDTSLFAVTVEGAAAPYTVTVGVTGYHAEGAFAGTLTIDADGVANGPLNIPLTLAVAPTPPAPTLATCWHAADSQCLELTSTCGPALEAFAAECAASGLSATCPVGGRVGGCRLPWAADQYTYWLYAPAWTETSGQGLCAAMPGTWVAPEPRLVEGWP